MRTGIFAFTLLISIGLSGSNLNAEPTQHTVVKFSVDNMTCATCPISVRKAMERVEGVKSVKVDWKTKVATVIFDADITTAENIGNSSTDVGFPTSKVLEK